MLHHAEMPKRNRLLTVEAGAIAVNHSYGIATKVVAVWAAVIEEPAEAQE